MTPSTPGFFSDKTQPMLILLIEATAFTALLIPILLCLLHSSPVFERRKLIWKVMVGEIVLGLLVGAWAIGVMVRVYSTSSLVALSNGLS
jgi:hypothetical protein